MTKPKFIEKHIDGRFEYHLPVTYERFLSNTLYDNSDFRLEKEVVDDLMSFVAENNISSFIGWDENSILYFIALKELANQKKCLLVYFDQADEIFQIQKHANPIKAEWCNSIQFTRDDDFCESFGIQSPETFLDSVNYFNKDLTNRYFYLSEIEAQNISRYTKLYNSDVTNWFFLFCEEENEQQLKSILCNKNEKPGIHSILKLCSSTVNIQIGGDEGYLDYVLIQSKSDIGHLIQEIEEKQTAFIQDYEELLKTCKPFDEEWKVNFYKERMTELLEIRQEKALLSKTDR